MGCVPSKDTTTTTTTTTTNGAVTKPPATATKASLTMMSTNPALTDVVRTWSFVLYKLSVCVYIELHIRTWNAHSLFPLSLSFQPTPAPA